MIIKTVKTKTGIIRQGMENKAERFILPQYIFLVQKTSWLIKTKACSGTGGMSRKDYQESPEKGLEFLNLN